MGDYCDCRSHPDSAVLPADHATAHAKAGR